MDDVLSRKSEELKPQFLDLYQIGRQMLIDEHALSLEGTKPVAKISKIMDSSRIPIGAVVASLCYTGNITLILVAVSIAILFTFSYLKVKLEAKQAAIVVQKKEAELYELHDRFLMRVSTLILKACMKNGIDCSTWLRNEIQRQIDTKTFHRFVKKQADGSFQVNTEEDIGYFKFRNIPCTIEKYEGTWYLDHLVLGGSSVLQKTRSLLFITKKEEVNDRTETSLFIDIDV